MQVLHRQRLVEPVLLADLLEDLGVAVLARHDERRIARQQLLQQEDDHRHEEQRRDELGQPPREEGDHGARAAPAELLQPQPGDPDQPVGHHPEAVEPVRVREESVR